MTIEFPWWLAAIITAIPTGISGIGFWMIQRKLTKRDELQAERDRARLSNEYLLIKKLDATVTLAEATARAVQRIPDAKCNGDMHAALEYAEKVKREHRAFITEQGIHQLYD